MAKRITIRKSRHLLTGGPFHGKIILLSCPGTLTFSCNGQTGRYNALGHWVEKTKP